MKDAIANLKRSMKALRHHKWKWGYMTKEVKLEMFKQGITLHIESRRSLLNISVAAIGLNMAMLTLPAAHHGRILHMTAGLAVISFFIAAVSISNYLLHQAAHLKTISDEDVINGIKESPALSSIKESDKATRRGFNTGVILSGCSIIQILCATFPPNWF